MEEKPLELSAEQLVERYARGAREFAFSIVRFASLESIDLHGANLHRADLSDASLVDANLSDANLSGAELSGADLRGANLGGAMLSGAYLHEANLHRANLHDTRLGGAKLSGAKLSSADLRGADLSDANLSDANLKGADLRGANLKGANLKGANLSGADLKGADLSDALLLGASLSGASLGDASLPIADLTRTNGIELGDTVLCDVNLSPFCRAEVDHRSGSPVDFRSIVRSLHEPALKEFLRATGMPDVFVEYMIDCARSLDPREIFSLLQSTFISYGGPDENFARKLNNALEKRGVTTFFFKDDAPAGEKLHRVMRKGVNEHDRVILICSESSLQRAGLMNELEETLARESRDGGRTYLLPVRLDDYVIHGWKPTDPDVAQAVRDRVIADFREHGDPTQFEAGVSKLIAALKRPFAPA